MAITNIGGIGMNDTISLFIDNRISFELQSSLGEKNNCLLIGIVGDTRLKERSEDFAPTLALTD